LPPEIAAVSLGPLTLRGMQEKLLVFALHWVPAISGR
jgi:hypothetical protein